MLKKMIRNHLRLKKECRTPLSAQAPPRPKMGNQNEDPLAEIFGQDLRAVLISNDLDQLDALVDSVEDNVEVIVFDPDQDDVSDIVDSLALLTEETGQEIGQLAIISHAAQGALPWGNGQVWTIETILADSSPWTELGGLLSENAVIDLYGCFVGAGEKGMLFVETLSSVTGAYVRASDDATGNVDGSDWVLEVTTGRNDASSLLDEDLLEPGTIRLDDLVGDDAVDDDLTIAATDSYNNVYGLGGDDTITWNGGTITGTINGGDDTDTLYLNVADGVVNITYDGTPSSGTLTYDYGDTTTYSISWIDFESVYLTANDNDNTIDFTEGSRIDQVDGGNGSDTLNATYSDVRIYGDDSGSVADGTTTNSVGSSTLATWTGMETVNILGTTGGDTITIDSSGAVTSVDSGDDNDRIYNYGTVTGGIDGGGDDDFIINIGTVSMSLDGGEGHDTITNRRLVSENIYGGDGDDGIYNTDNSTVCGDIDGGLGDDTISLWSSGDTPCTVGGRVYGGDDSGVDTLEAEYAEVTIIGDDSGVVGSGTATNSTRIHEWAGFETVTINAPSHTGADITIDASAAVTYVGGNGDNYSDTITNRGTVAGDIDGSDGGDEIHNYGMVIGDMIGGEGGDHIHNYGTVATDIDGSGGADKIYNYGTVTGDINGGGGNDTITWDGGTITGIIDGEDDDDTLRLNMVDEVVDITYDGTPSAGTLTYDCGDTTTHSISWTALESVFLTANDHDNTIAITAGSQVDLVDGGDGSDTLNGTYSDVRIYGDDSGSVADGTATNSGGSATLTTWTGMESVNILGTTGGDTITIDSTGAVTSIDGGDSDDQIKNYGTVLQGIDGSGGNDSIGNYGTVSGCIDGGEGQDTITNGRLVSEDTLGGSDDDAIYNAENGTVWGDIDGGSGDDLIGLWSYNATTNTVGGKISGGEHTVGDTLEAQYHAVTIYGDDSGAVGSGTSVYATGVHEWEGFETVTIKAPWFYWAIITIDESATVTNVKGDIHNSSASDTIINRGTVTGVIDGSEGSDTLYNYGSVGGDIDGGDGSDTIYNHGTVSGNLDGDRYSDEINNYDLVGGDINGGDSPDTINNYGSISGSVYGDRERDTITNSGSVGGSIYGDDNDTTTSDGNDTIIVTSSGTVAAGIYGEGGDDEITNNGMVTTNIQGDAGSDSIYNYGTVQQVICGNEGDDHVYFFGGGVGTLAVGEDEGGGDLDTLHLTDRCTNINVNGETGSFELDGNSASWIEFESTESVSVNDAPVASSFGATGNEDEFIVVDFTGQFDDPCDTPENNPLYITIVSVPDNGTLYLDQNHDGVFETALAADTTVSWTDATDRRIAFLGDSNWNGTTSFTYTVTDDGGTAGGGQDTDQTPATVTITVDPINDYPEITGPISVTFSEDDGTVSVDLLDGASDPDSSDTLSVHGLTLVDGDASGITDNGNSLSIDTSAYESLAVGESEVIRFSYNVIDGNGGSISQTATITINGANDDPQVTGPVVVTVTEDDGTISVDLLDGASDPDTSDTLSVDGLTLIDGDASGITDNGNSLSLDTSAYESLAVGESEVIHYSYNVIDADGGSVAQTATITITGANDDPEVSGPVVVTVTEDDGTISIDLLDGASDPDSSDTLNVDGLTLVDGDASGITDNGNSLSLDSSAYESLALGESEVIHYSYNVIDADGGSVAQTATITITGANDDPEVAGPITVTVSEDAGTLSVGLLDGASDPDSSDTLNVHGLTLVDGDASGITDNGNSFSLDTSAYESLAVGESKVIHYSYNVVDGNGGSVSQTATITITGANDDPEVNVSVSVTVTDIDGTISVDLLDGASDPDSSDTRNVVGLTLVDGDASGVTNNGNSLTVDTSVYESLAVGESEVIHFTYNVIDGNGGSVSQTATITITGTNNAPSSSNGVVTTVEDVSYTFKVTDFSFQDPEAGDTLHSVRITQRPEEGRLYCNGNPVDPGDEILVDSINNGFLLFEPGQDGNGNPYVDFRFQVSDGTDFSHDSYTMNIAVEAVNDAPVITAPGKIILFADMFSTIAGISVADVDAIEGTGRVEVTLTVDHGILNLSQTADLTFSSGGNGTSNMTFSGLIADVNNALSTLTYTPDAQYVGADTIQVLVDDLENFGAGGRLKAEQTVDVEFMTLPEFDEPVREYLPLSGVTDGSVSGTGPLNPEAFMPAIGSLLEFLSTKGLLPQSSTNGQGSATDSASESFQQIGTLLSVALFGETEETQDQSWDSLLWFVSEKRAEGGEEWLELAEFFTRLQQWQIGTTLDEILLVFNASEIKLAEWFHSLMTSHDELPGRQDVAVSQSIEFVDKSPSIETMVFDLNRLRVADLLSLDLGGHNLTGSDGLRTEPSTTVCRVFDPSDPNLLDALTI
jgi:VCBS repeat-containing protein